MSNYFVYKSKFAPYIEALLREKEQKGKLKSTMFKCYMLEFDRFFYDNNITEDFITEEIILRWKATRLNDNERNLYHKYIAWIHLCKYMCELGVECYIPRTPKSGRQNDYIPYIYSHDEINLLFSTADKLRIIKGENRTTMFVIPALLRLLYSTGIRIGEALSLKNKDLDLENRIIYINRTKNEMQRLAVINNSLFSVLQRYVENRDHIPFRNNNAEESYFFSSQLGKPCNYGSIISWFHRTISYGKIPKQASISRPRIHDIRHTAAVHSLDRLVRSGMDIYCALPLLSAFLGHKNIRSTESYVKLTHEMFPDLITAQKFSEYIFPSINNKQLDDDDGFC